MFRCDPIFPVGLASLRQVAEPYPMPTLALADLYADPHRLDSLLEGGERIAVMRDGRLVAEIVPCSPPLAPCVGSSRRVRLPFIEGTAGNVIRPTRADLDAACFGGSEGKTLGLAGTGGGSY